MQTFLVLITFVVALGFLLKKFAWDPIFESRNKSLRTIDGHKTKCGKKDCGCG